MLAFPDNSVVILVWDYCIASEADLLHLSVILR